jgi:hypothetical protein
MGRVGPSAGSRHVRAVPPLGVCSTRSPAGPAHGRDYTDALFEAGFLIEKLQKVGETDPADKWNRLPLFLRRCACEPASRRPRSAVIAGADPALVVPLSVEPHNLRRVRVGHDHSVISVLVSTESTCTWALGSLSHSAVAASAGVGNMRPAMSVILTLLRSSLARSA